MNNTVDITEFFNKDFCKYASYDTLRSLANYVDGLKISERKAIWVALTYPNVKRVKVSQFSSKVSEATNYIHGEMSMQSVITNLGRNYIGSNNINLLKPDGNFGTRFVKKPSAPRYIFVDKEPIIDKIFKKEDLDILEKQYFEGEEIEPRFLMPIIPLLLVNGVDAVGTGFSQTILPRNPIEIIDIIEDFVKGNGEKYNGKYITPWYKGYTGKIRRTEDDKSWEILGHIRYKNDTTLIIDEVPIGYSLSSYKEVLDKLKERKKIRGYSDLSENDKFLFEVKVSRSDEDTDSEELLDTFKLIKRESENFSSINEDNKVVDKSDNICDEFDIIRHFIPIRLDYIEKRKNRMLKKYLLEIKVAKNKANFIKGINSNEIKVQRVKTDDLIKTLESMEFDKIGDSYSYLLDLKIHTLTEEKYTELKEQLKKLVEKYNNLKNSSIEDLYLKDLEELKEELINDGRYTISINK